MGVHGLKHLIQWHHKSCLSNRSLHGCRLLIDGNNLAYLLYTRAPGICSPLGGDYDKFAAHVAYFFARLQQCDIEATVLMDGGQPRNNVKLHTCTTRLQVTLNTCMDLKPSRGSYIRVFPLHARSVFLSVLKRIGVLVIQCDFEADQDLAFLAQRYNAKVLSNDSDFFLYNVDYVLLDSLNYHKVKKRVDRQGVQRWSIPCKVFLKETFLGQCRLQQHHLGLIAALCANDCVPASFLKEFHEYLNSGRRRKVGHTKRQNLIQLVIAFLVKQGAGGTTDAIIEKVLQRVRGDFRARLRSLLLRSVSSYRPSSSDVEEDVLAGWRIRKRLREEGHDVAAEQSTGDSSRGQGCRTDHQEDTCQMEDKVTLEELKPKGKKQKLGQSHQSKSSKTNELEKTIEKNSRQNHSAQKKNDTDDCWACDCAKMWLGLIDLPGDDILSKNCGVWGNHCDDKLSPDAVALEIDSDGDEKETGRVRLVGDTEEEEDEAEEEEEGDELYNEDDGGGVCEADDEREIMTGVGADVSKDVTVADDGTGEKSSSSNEVQANKIETGAVSSDVPPIKNWETMSKKQRKKELERLKHQERMNRKLNKKAEALENEKISRKEKHSITFDITGMDANQILKTLEKKQKRLLVQDTDEGIFDATENESYPLLSDMTLSSALDEQTRATSTDGAACSHGRSDLVTSFGYRLPAWEMYGYRHCCVSREVSDIVTNNFCISPPQVEDVASDSCYRATERLVKLIVVLARGGGSNHSAGTCDAEMVTNDASAATTTTGANSECTDDTSLVSFEEERTSGKKENGKLDLLGDETCGDRKENDANDSCVSDGYLKDDVFDVQTKNRSSKSKNKKQRKRKNDEILRWFIRDGDDLLIEEIDLREIFEEFSEVPSLKSIENLTRDDRKEVFLRSVFPASVNSSELLNLPEEFQLVMIHICYWYKNCLSLVDEKHLLTVLLSLIMFYVVCGKINRSRQARIGVACVHCILKQSEGYKAKGEIKRLVDAMACNKDAYHDKKYKRKRMADGNKFQSKRNAHDEMLEVTDDEAWELTSKAPSSISSKKLAPSGEEIDAQRFKSAGELSYLTDALSEEECYQVNERMTGFHNSYNIDNANFDITFIHSMSEYQASVHYLNLLNGLMMLPFPPVYMERIWSGTFSFNVFKTLRQFSDRLDLLIALLLGPESSLFRIFVHLYSFLRRFLGLEFNVTLFPGLDRDSVIERFLQQSAATDKAKKKVKKVTKKELVTKKTKEKVEMDVDEHCAILSLSATGVL